MTHTDVVATSTSEAPLLPQHQALLAASAIPDHVAAARGYQSLTTQAAVRRYGFSASQARIPALLLPIWDIFGEVATYQLHPDLPRIVAGKVCKYETPPGTRMVLDVPPLARPALTDPSIPLFLTEGIRKADAAVGLGLCCVALLGVWTFRGSNDQGGKSMLPDWEQIALNGRRVYVGFDSDAMTKPGVHVALERLTAWLRRRGAEVCIVYLPAGPCGAKTGLDDFIAAGRSVDELLANAESELRPMPVSTGAEDADAGPYMATERGLVWRKETREGTTETLLANFTATITGDTLADDGAEIRRQFELAVQLHGRAQQVAVPASQFAGLSWVPELLGAGAIVAPGMGLRDHTRAAIQLLSGPVPTRHVYAHTGWRQLDGQWCFLHAGGAIGAVGALSDIEVALDGPLSRFTLPVPPSAEEARTALLVSLALLDQFPLELAVPLLGAVYVAPLRQALSTEAPDFVPWFHGPSGTFKSELLALAQAHFGDFARQTLPLSFTATANAVERLAFIAKDAVLVVDDYHPASDPREAQEMARVASRLLRGAGNASGRTRLKADTSLRPALVPRCLPLVSGERLPEGHSTVARMFPVPVAPGAINPTILSAAQAARGQYPLAMSGYLQWLAARMNRAEAGWLVGRYRALRQQAQQTGGHRREPGQVAHLLLGLETVLAYGVELSVLTAAEQAERLAGAGSVLLEQAREHGEAQAEDAPHRLFLRLLADGFASKQIYLEGRDGEAPLDGQRWGWEVQRRYDRDGLPEEEFRHLSGGTLLGTLEPDWLLLAPETTYRYLVAASRTAGRVFPVDQKTLWRRLTEAGLIATEEGGRRHLVNAWSGGGTRRVLKLRRDALEGEIPVEGAGAAGEDPDIDDAPQDDEPQAGVQDNSEAPGPAPVQAVFATGIPHIPDIPKFRDQEERSTEEVMEWTAIP